MRILLLCSLLLINYFFASAQENKDVLSAPGGWQKEVLVFPLSFAPAINYTGYEDLRFTPGWAKKDSDQFWTYTFAWYIDKNTPLSAKNLSAMLQQYFDGLMGINADGAPDSIRTRKTVATMDKTKDGFKGSIKAYDAFFTKQLMTLHVTVKETNCPKSNKQLILFRFSPKSFEHSVWNVFEEVKIVGCE